MSGSDAFGPAIFFETRGLFSFHGPAIFRGFLSQFIRYMEVERKFGDELVSIRIGAVHDQIENFGLQEGILFLDEINCVSETLALSMLQFLQYKVFGRHKVPDGWIVVTAGNPPEYNNSVREFDIVTWDRLKRIDVKPNIEVWREYAIAHDVHPAVALFQSAGGITLYFILSHIPQVHRI